MWTYRCYVTNHEPNLWAAWYRDNPNAHGAHDSVFGMIEQMRIWTEPHYKPLKGRQYKGVGEIRFLADRQWRIFGFFDGPQVFTITAIGSKKQRVYDPKKVMDTATKRMKEIKADDTKAARCERPT